MSMRARLVLVGSLVVGTLLGSFGEAAKKTFLYVHSRHASANEIWGFQVDGAGQMTAVPGSPATLAPPSGNCGGHCQTAAYSAKRKMLFASGDGLSAFFVGKDGALTPHAGNPFLPGADLNGVAVVEKGKKTFVYASSFDDDEIRGFAVATNGAITELPGSPFATSPEPSGLSAAGGRLFAAHENGALLSSFRVANDGSLIEAPNSPVATGAGFIYNVQADAGGKFVYTGDDDADELHAYSVNPANADLTPLPGSPIATGVRPSQGMGVAKKLLIAQDSAGGGVDDVQAFLRNKQTGALTPTNPQSTGIPSVRTSNIDAAGKLYAVASGTSDQVRTFLVGADGTLQTADTEAVALLNPNQALFIKR